MKKFAENGEGADRGRKAPPRKGDPAVAARIAQVIDEAGGIRKTMRATGISDSALRRYADGTNKPPADRLKAIADFAGVAVSWILTGNGPLISEENLGSDLALSGDVVEIPVLSVHAGAGAGFVNHEVEETSRRLFPKAFLRERGARADRVQFLVARGDSMSPTIEDGALVLVDRSQREIVDGGIYVVSLGDEVRIKRVRKSIGGKLTLCSDGDQKRFPDEPLSDADAAQLVVHGRVFWTEKRL